MLILVTGGSCSGKSVYAESLLAEAGDHIEKYYIATMQATDAESRIRVEKHRAQRAGKGFVTIEQAKDVQAALTKMKNGPGRRAALLECMSNLTANEMFEDGRGRSETMIVQKICRDMDALEDKLDVLIVVSNNVFEDGVLYDMGTQAYLRALGAINAHLAETAQQVYEVVAGIPILCKPSLQSTV